MIHTIAFSKGFLAPNPGAGATTGAVNALVLELAKSGFLPCPALLEEFMRSSDAELSNIADELRLYNTLYRGMGDYKPLFTNFPDMSAYSELERFGIQLMHYIARGAVGDVIYQNPGLVKELGFPSDYTTLSLGTSADYVAYLEELAYSPTPLNPFQTKAVIALAGKVDSSSIDPDKVVLKDNLVVLVEHGVTKVSTAIDFLRLAVYLSGGTTDITLPRSKSKRADAKYKFKFDHRKAQILLDAGQAAKIQWLQDMATGRKRGRFIRMFEQLDIAVRKYSLRYPEQLKKVNVGLRDSKAIAAKVTRHPAGASQDVRAAISSNGKILTFQSRVAAESSVAGKATVLSERPGELLRSLVYLMRNCVSKLDTEALKGAVLRSALKSSMKVLIEICQLIAGMEVSDFAGATTEVTVKKKSGALKTRKVTCVRQELREEIIGILLTALKARLSGGPIFASGVSTVYIDPDFKKVPVQTSQKGKSETANFAYPGVRYRIEAQSVRLFLHWINRRGEGSASDLDLSAFAVYPYSHEIMAYNHTMPHAVFSGDVTSQDGPCAEYIDCDLKAFRQKGCRYIIQSVKKFSGVNIGDLELVEAGVSSNTTFSPSRTWIPSDVIFSARITRSAESQQVIALEIKPYGADMIVLDQADTGGRYFTDGVRDAQRYADVLDSYKAFSMFDIVEAIVDGSGYKVITDPASADAVIACNHDTVAEFIALAFGQK